MLLTESSLRAALSERTVQEAIRGERTRDAAVAAVVRFGTEAEVLFIRRTERPHDHWSGQMAFPGGRKDASDVDTLATALREAREEVGIELARDGELIGRLDDLQAVAHGRAIDLVIAPYVFILRAEVELAIDPEEVDLALWAPLEPMLSGALDTTRPYVLHGSELDLPAYQVGPHIVWGLTHRMLCSLFNLLSQ